MGGIAKGAMNFLTGGNDDVENAYQQQVKDLVARIEKEWKLPSYDQTPLTPKEYTLLNTYAPQVAGFVEQQAPQLLSNVNTQAKQAQTQSLSQLSDYAKTGDDLGTRAEYEQANLKADQTLRSNRANALNLLAQRGLGSSGATLGADIGAGLAAGEQQRAASVQSASDAAKRKLAAIQGLGSLGSEVSGQEQQKEEFNANTLNQYNQLLANRRQQYQNYAAEIQNEANKYNQQQSQGVANANTGLENQYGMYNQQRRDKMMEAMTNAENERLRLESGLQGGAAQQGLGYGLQKEQNETQQFMNMLAIGGAAAAASMGAPPSAGSNAVRSVGPSSNYTPSDYGSYGNVNPNYSLYDQSGAVK